MNSGHTRGRGGKVARYAVEFWNALQHSQSRMPPPVLDPRTACGDGGSSGSCLAAIATDRKRGEKPGFQPKQRDSGRDSRSMLVSSFRYWPECRWANRVHSSVRGRGISCRILTLDEAPSDCLPLQPCTLARDKWGRGLSTRFVDAASPFVAFRGRTEERGVEGTRAEHLVTMFV